MTLPFPELPKYALSIQQPWAWLIVNGHKDIENRDWSTKYRGPIAIHAGKKIDKGAAWYMSIGSHPASGQTLPPDHPAFMPKDAPWDNETGGIVGFANIIDCVTRSESEWFVGKYGFMICDARPIKIIPVKGKLGFFDWRAHLEPSHG